MSCVSKLLIVCVSTHIDRYLPDLDDIHVDIHWCNRRNGMERDWTSKVGMESRAGIVLRDVDVDVDVVMAA